MDNNYDLEKRVKEMVEDAKTEYSKCDKIAQMNLQSQEFAKRVFADGKQDALAELLTKMSDMHSYKFKGKCLYRYDISGFIYDSIYCLNNFEIVLLSGPTDLYDAKVESGLTPHDLSDLYARFMDITYPDFREKYLDYKNKQEISKLERGKEVIKDIIDNAKTPNNPSTM